MMNRLIFVKKNGEEINLSETKILIWGGGRFTRRECQRLMLDDAEYVIDSDPGKQGTEYQLYLEEREIVGPTILSELDYDQCFILVSNKYYAAEIAKKIDEEYPLWRDQHANITDVYFKYQSIEEMVYLDRRVMEEACTSNILLLLPEYIRKMNDLIHERLEVQQGEYILCPLRKSTKVVFYIETKQGKYIGKLPSWDRWVASYSHRRNLIELKEKIQIDGLVLYEDIYGYSISRVADEINDWNNLKLLDEARNAIRKIHNCNLTIDESANEVRYIRLEDFRKVIPEIDTDLFANIRKECAMFQPVLCHNDLHCGNILIYKDEAVLIDFEDIAMGDKVYDTAKLIMDLIYFRNCRLFSGIEEAGEYFLGIQTYREKVHLYACVIAQLMKNTLLVEERGENVFWQKQELRNLIQQYCTYIHHDYIQ